MTARRRKPIELTLRIGRDTVTIRVERDAPEVVVDAASPTAAPPDLREIEAAILRSAHKVPESPKLVARRTGYKYNSYFREAVSGLVAAKLLTRTVDGIALPVP